MTDGDDDDGWRFGLGEDGGWWVEMTDGDDGWR